MRVSEMERELLGWRVWPGLSQGDSGWDMEVVPGQESKVTKGFKKEAGDYWRCGMRQPRKGRSPGSELGPQRGQERPRHTLGLCCQLTGASNLPRADLK